MIKKIELYPIDPIKISVKRSPMGLPSASAGCDICKEIVSLKNPGARVSTEKEVDICRNCVKQLAKLL